MTRGGSPEGARARRPARVLVLSGPSGAGKSSLARALVDDDGRDRQGGGAGAGKSGLDLDRALVDLAGPSLGLSVSHTTRAARPGEVDGVDYHFVSEREFDAMAAAGAFLEHARVFDRRYGTSWEAVRAELSRGNDVVLDIDWQGARQVREAFADTVSVLILPPSLDALRARLVKRSQDSAPTIERRMSGVRSEIEHYEEFDYIVFNDDFESALTAVRAILRGGDAMPPGHAMRPAEARPFVADLLALRHPQLE